MQFYLDPTVSYRTFKTHRDRRAEETRNPSLFMRLKNKLLQSTVPPAASQTSASDGTIDPSLKAKPTAQQQERLKGNVALVLC